jgi:iron(III) transport system ATP-binding protein
LGAAGITSILVTHDQPEALSFADQIVVLDHGRLMQAGQPRELYQKPRDELTATVLGEAIVLPATLGDGFADSALGRIPVETGSRRGPATIMLRPEQLVLTLAIAGAEPAACYGHLTELEFGGAVSTGTMTLEQAAPPLRIRVSGANLLRAGDRVRVSVTGRAHIVG